MTLALSGSDIGRFSSLIAQRLGLGFEDDRQDFLSDVLRQRLAASGAALPETYFRRLSVATVGGDELRALAELLTIGETYFFRNPDHFRAFVELVLPNRMKAQGERHQLRILSAGCASGEEAYSLAILLHDHIPALANWDLSIRGIDVNAAMVGRATEARYTAWSLRATNDDVRARHFRATGKRFVLNQPIRSMVAFEERNLVEEAPGFWREDAFDVVFCRNVTMYFPRNIASAVVDRFARSLAPGGYLFLGHAETLRGISNQFHLRHTHDTFYYQRREGSDGGTIAFVASSPDSTTATVAILPHSDASWADVIARSTDHIARLAADSRNGSTDPDGVPTSTSSPASRRSWSIGLALELLREDRFAEALGLLQALPDDASTDVDAQLLRAVLLINTGNLEAAEATCRQLLLHDELNAGAHYLTALAREHVGDLEGAAEHDQAAIYLDPVFAMPHLHLGLMARRAQEYGRAQRPLERALVLLVREDASRILLFGGGFTREALLGLCRAELLTAGGTP